MLWMNLFRGISAATTGDGDGGCGGEGGGDGVAGRVVLCLLEPFPLELDSLTSFPFFFDENGFFMVLRLKFRNGYKKFW
jgi:hypothetical protein